MIVRILILLENVFLDPYDRILILKQYQDPTKSSGTFTLHLSAPSIYYNTVKVFEIRDLIEKTILGVLEENFKSYIRFY